MSEETRQTVYVGLRSSSQLLRFGEDCRENSRRLMCNLDTETKGHAAIRALFRADRDNTGTLPLLPAIFPDQGLRSSATRQG
jgi:hypothetical protein